MCFCINNNHTAQKKKGEVMNSGFIIPIIDNIYIAQKGETNLELIPISNPFSHCMESMTFPTLDKLHQQFGENRKALLSCESKNLFHKFLRKKVEK